MWEKETKGEEQITCAAVPATLKIEYSRCACDGEEALHLIQLELNGVDACCSVESSFVESMCLVGEPKWWCFKPLMPSNLNTIFSNGKLLQGFLRCLWNRNIFCFCTERRGYARGEMEMPNPSINFHSASSVQAEFFLWRRFHHLFGGKTEDVCVGLGRKTEARKVFNINA